MRLPEAGHYDDRSQDDAIDASVHWLASRLPGRPELFKEIQHSYLVDRTHVAEPSEPITPVICTHAARADAAERQPVLCHMNPVPTVH
jgi:hypothetical protein